MFSALHLVVAAIATWLTIGVLGLVRSLVVELKPIRVNSLHPTGVDTPMLNAMSGLTERIEAKRAVLKDGRWELEDAWVSAVGQEPALYQHYLLSTYLTPSQVRDSLGTVFSISFWDLPNFIQIADQLRGATVGHPCVMAIFRGTRPPRSRRPRAS